MLRTRLPLLLTLLAANACSEQSARHEGLDAGATETGPLEASPPIGSPSDGSPLPHEDGGDFRDAHVPDGEPDATTVPSSDSGREASTAPGDATASDAARDARRDSPDDAGLAFAPYPAVPYPTENPHSAEKAILGKILFWEEQLSSDDTVACGTCHRSNAGGSDPRAATAASRHPGPDATLGTPDDIHGSLGIARCQLDGDAGMVTYIGDPVFGTAPQVTSRKAPTYLDAMFAPDIFWDGRAMSTFTDPDTGLVAIASGGGLESQAVGPPLSDAEMACEGRTWPDIHAKLTSVTPLALASNLPADVAAALAGGQTYPDLFQAAFGSPDITTRRIAFAIATHERLLTSNDTPWDRWNGGDEAAMTPEEIHGFEAFMGPGRCGMCHPPPLFTDFAFHNLGFVNADFDLGRQTVTADPADRGLMKTPSLRNVGLREAGGLLHDGAVHGASLAAVMAAYELPPNADSNTDPDITLLALTSTEKADIITFMRNALTDPRVRDEVFPFDRPKLGSEP